MRTTLKERDGNKVKVEIEVAPQDLKEAYDFKLRELVREVRIPGFRPGKAPATMVEQKLGEEAVLADAVESAMTHWFVQGMVDLGLEAVDRPEVDMGEDLPSLDKPLTFSAEVMVMPEVKLGEYKGLKVPKDSAEVTDEEIDSRVERLQNEFAELRPVEGRTVQKGDFVLADFQATLDGQPVGELEASDYLFEVGGGQIFPEADEQVVGMKSDETKSFPVALSEEVPSDELRGKTVELSLTLKEIKEKVLPELTDDWVAEVAEFKTVEEFRGDIRSRLESAKSYTAEQKYRSMAVTKAADNVDIELPDVVIRREAAELLSEFQSSLEARGGTLEGYLAATGIPFEKMVEDLLPQAANNVKARLVLDAVVKTEELEVSDEELSSAIDELAAANRLEVKEVEKRLRKNDRMSDFKEQILRDKAVETIVQSAVAGPPEGDSEAGKKSAAKKATGATGSAKSSAEKTADVAEPAAKAAAADAADGPAE